MLILPEYVLQFAKSRRLTFTSTIIRTRICAEPGLFRAHYLMNPVHSVCLLIEHTCGDDEHAREQKLCSPLHPRTQCLHLLKFYRIITPVL